VGLPSHATELPLAGAFFIEPSRFDDERGSFVRSWSTELLRGLGLASDWAYAAYAHNRRSGTLRGLHYQLAPYEERKLVTCVRGDVWDVLLDLRVGSSTYGRWHGVTLSAESLASVYVPEGLAHGYVTLTDDAVVSYQISPAHAPAAAAGVRWNDPAFGIKWPIEPVVLSDRDRSFPLHQVEA
jgi:dTDP-4-dehydrorhamnose 3,5-epimerase